MDKQEIINLEKAIFVLKLKINDENNNLTPEAQEDSIHFHKLLDQAKSISKKSSKEAQRLIDGAEQWLSQRKEKRLNHLKFDLSVFETALKAKNKNSK
jgi:pantothenate synthetase